MPFVSSVQPDRERGRLTIGFPGVASAEIPVHDSLLESLRTRFRARPAESLISAPWAELHVHASEGDDGRASFCLSLVNMLNRPVKVERLNLELFLIGGVSATIAAPLFTPPAELIPACSIKELRFNIALSAPAIRQLGQHIQKAQNAYSSPLIEFTCGGSLDVTVRKNIVRVPFSVLVRTPQMHLSGAAVPVSS